MCEAPTWSSPSPAWTETNLVCCLIAKSLGAQHTVARVRNPDYRRDADMLKREIGLDMVINPRPGGGPGDRPYPQLPAAISVEVLLPADAST